MEENGMKTAVVLAAGKGTRMQSELPKVMHTILSETMVEHVLSNLNTIKDDFSKLISFVEIEELELSFILNYIDKKIYFKSIKSLWSLFNAINDSLLSFKSDNI